jgi:hypothetical protein
MLSLWYTKNPVMFMTMTIVSSFSSVAEQGCRSVKNISGYILLIRIGLDYLSTFEYVDLLPKVTIVLDLPVVSKVIIEKSRGDGARHKMYLSLAYIRVRKKKKNHFILCNFLVRTLQCFYLFFAHENMKKPASKVAHNWP